MKNIAKHTLVMVMGMMAVGLMPIAASADVEPLSQSTPSDQNINLVCSDFSTNVFKNSTGEAVRMLQYFLVTKEQAVLDPSVWGTFDQTTMDAVKSFQGKYGIRTTGNVFTLTRAKLKQLYGCQNLSAPVVYSNVKLTVTNITLDSTGVTTTFCNGGSINLPSAPFRIRLNGVNRDLEVLGAHAAGSCDTENLPYSFWGLTYDAGSTFGAVAIIDPFNFYRKGSLQVPLSNTSILKVPAVVGAHLSVRGIALKSTGVQPTFCNLGTTNLTSFPVRVTVNGIAKDFDVPGAYKSGQCVPVTYTYDMFGLTYTPGTVYTVQTQTDPNNVIAETNEYDNAAVTVGMP